jgi:hypothetical protein
MDEKELLHKKIAAALFDASVRRLPPSGSPGPGA